MIRSRYLLSVLALVFLEACRTPSIVATQSMIEGNMANNVNDYAMAIRHYETYLQASKQLGLYRDMQEEASVCRHLAHAYATLGEFRKSQHYLLKAVYNDSVFSDRSALTEDYRALGEVYAYKGDYDRSLIFLSKAGKMSQRMDVSPKINERETAAAIQLSVAQVNLSLGNFTEAETAGFKAHAIYETINHPVGMIESKLILGIIARERNDLVRAEKRLMEVLQDAQNMSINTSRITQAISEVHWLRGDIEQTIRYKIAGLDEAEKSGIKPQQVIANMRLGDVYHKLGDQKKATSFFQRAMDIESAFGESTPVSSLTIRAGDVNAVRDAYVRSSAGMGKALVALRLGSIYLGKNATDSAIYFFDQASSLFEKKGSREGLANAKVLLGKVYTSLNQLAIAEKMLREAKMVSIQPEIHWQVHHCLGIIQESLNLPDSAKLNYERAIRIIDQMRSNLTLEEFKVLFSNTKVDVYDRLIQLLLKNKSRWQTERPAEEAFYLSERSRSRAFLDMMGNHRMNTKSLADSTVLNKEHTLRLSINQVNKELVGATDSDVRLTLDQRLHQLQDEHQQIIQRIKLSHPDYANFVTIEPQSLTAIQKELDSKTALIEYWVGDRQTVIWVITKGNIQTRSVNVSRTALLRTVQGCRNGVAVRDEAFTNKALSTLYNDLFRPIHGDLKSITRLIIVPHRSLHFLPFQALLSPSQRFLVEDYVISYAPSASVWHACRQRKAKVMDSVFALAMGEKSLGDFDALPGTVIELTQIGKVYQDKMESRVGEAFTESYFKEAAKNYGYIHVATHGAMNVQQPLYSYLLMFPSDHDDGQLTVEEIFGMDIRGNLVTLSACETGLGELGQGDELIGLSRAFMYAGAPSVIVSLWKVEDSTTAWLMTRFYQYLSAGNPTAESLTFAQRDLLNLHLKAGRTSVRGIKDVAYDPTLINAINRQGKASRMPYFWAPFILVGSN